MLLLKGFFFFFYSGSADQMWIYILAFALVYAIFGAINSVIKKK